MRLAELAVADWDGFLARHRIDLTCTGCGGGRPRCRMCHGTSPRPAGPTAYDSGFKPFRRYPRVPVPGTVAFTLNDTIWLAPTGDGVAEAVPRLALAWVVLFPRCQWVPDQFVDTARLAAYHEVLGAAGGKVLARMRAGFEAERTRATDDLKALDRYLKKKTEE
jgi:hypothetical protein